MDSSYSYASFAPPPSRRVPRLARSRGLGLAAAAAALVVAFVAFRALFPDASYGFQSSFGLDATIHVRPLGVGDPYEIALRLQARLRLAEIPAEVVLAGGGITVAVDGDDLERARAWVLPQGRLELLLTSGLEGKARADVIRRVQEFRLAGSYDPADHGHDVLPHPDGPGEVLVERFDAFPRGGYSDVWVGEDDAGRPALTLLLTRAGRAKLFPMTIRSQGRAIAAVLDGKLLSLNHLGFLLGSEVTLGIGWSADNADRLATVVRYPLPAPLVELK